MALETQPFDPADHLNTDEARVAYLNEALESGDAVFASKALGHVLKSIQRTTAGAARDAGITRAAAHRALTGATVPGFDTFLALVRTAGFDLKVTPKHPEAA